MKQLVLLLCNKIGDIYAMIYMTAIQIIPNANICYITILYITIVILHNYILYFFFNLI